MVNSKFFQTICPYILIHLQKEKRKKKTQKKLGFRFGTIQYFSEHLLRGAGMLKVKI